MSTNGVSAKATEVYNTIIKRERLSGLLWLVWGVITLGGGIVWRVLFNKGYDEAKAAFEAAFVEGARTWVQQEATIKFVTGLLIFIGALALVMAIFRLSYAWDMKRDPVGIYSHYQMRLKGRIVFLVLGCGVGSAIAVYDILTRKYVIENREYLIEVVNAHLEKIA
ncbi:MAG: hypothetical protein IKZ19_02425 [Clostridia bacterium]|nr:hypothetical protein [Clostridia bacterium]